MQKTSIILHPFPPSDYSSTLMGWLYHPPPIYCTLNTLYCFTIGDKAKNIIVSEKKMTLTQYLMTVIQFMASVHPKMADKALKITSIEIEAGNMRTTCRKNANDQ